MMLETLVKKQGKLPYDKIVSHTFPLEQINDAFEQAEWLDRQTSITRSMLVT
jgi:Zn-dependent alcohol dehydrogenase